MASRRTGRDAFGWSGRAGIRGSDASMEPAQKTLPPSTSLRSKNAFEESNDRDRATPQPKMPSKLPQSMSNRQPSDGRSRRPPLTHQSQSWSVGGGNQGATGIQAPVSSTSPYSGLPTPGTRRRNVLRRKLSGLQQEAASVRNDSRDGSITTDSSSSIPYSQTSLDISLGSNHDRNLSMSPVEAQTAQKVQVLKTMPQATTIYPELDRYRNTRSLSRAETPSFEVPYRITTHDLPPPTPLFSASSSQISGLSGSPSTRFSGSPGLSPYSRDTTPTSMSSQSPGLVAPLRIPSSVVRMRQADLALTRPPVSRRRTGSIPNEIGSVGATVGGLAAVRESLTSSSSNSTVRDGDKKEKKTKKVLSPLPPSPPPRTSSQKIRKNRDEHESPSKPSRGLVQPVTLSSAAVKASSYSRPGPAKIAQSVVSPNAMPPVRPSRDGTPDLQTQLGLPFPVIHSNLSSSSITERRPSTSTSERRQSIPLSLVPSNRSILERHNPSRLPVGREATPAPGAISSRDGVSVPQPETGRTTRTPSPGISTFKTRFPIFGRRNKTTQDDSQQEKKDKPTRKGPVAGTGHEGYGRLGSVRRRSSSIANNTRPIPGTMSSQESLVNSQPHDPFLLERMAPVVISGGEVIENRNPASELSRTESNQSFAFSRPSIESKNGSQVSLSSREGARNTLWPSPFPRGPTPPSLNNRRPSESSDSEAVTMKSSLAMRRSIQRLKSGEQEAPRVPKPIVTRPQVISPSITSIDASIMSDDSMFSYPAEASTASKELDTATDNSGPKKLMKRARSPRKWNLFSRSQSQPATEKKQTDVAPSVTTTVAATVKAVQSKPVAFYTMLDLSELEDIGTPDLKEVLREARTITAPSPDPRINTTQLMTQNSAHMEPTNLDDPLKRTLVSPVNYHQPLVPEMQDRPEQILKPVEHVKNLRQAPGRPSRLPQVGRIPKVVSARAEQTSPKSFSRPFHRLSVQKPPPETENRDAVSVAKGPSPVRPSTPDDCETELAEREETNISALMFSISKELSTNRGQSGEEFLSFSPRKNSQDTVTTMSSCSGGLLTFADATAVVPQAHAPLAEDEIWDEYNDLLGDETLRVPPSAGSSLGKPFHLEGYGPYLGKQREPVASSIYSVDFKEEIKQALKNDPAPANLSTESGILDDREARNNNVDSGREVLERQEDKKPAQDRRSDASGSTISSDDNSPLSQVNLRVGSMTVSKWLSFGHVLFSPVRDELIPVVGSLKRHSILVVDGLGNDDWSFYAAETYPEATFFNLSPRAPPPANHRSSTALPLSPPNHHQIQYLSHSEKFPFGAQSFTSVVFRFPAAGPESQYRNIISEARRVLKPGGFIELSILDVDLNNMGNRGRRAVRRLKERIHAVAPDTSLGSTSDLILRLLGRRGFADIKTCRVGVPVASSIAQSSGAARPTEGSRGKDKIKPKRDNRSLPEMIGEEGPVADENITKMVSKVGRWWYTRCYENAATTSASSSGSSGAIMWTDKALLAECEEWGTSLKLMVCHARIPDGKARIASI
ncbi:hypothetical protein B0T17DRAFT_624503 [Bombardia bombarda]|uniref:Methyltransferase type 11 domain-containing protein n=1 Tax=Bombardia bombarda TaxID=252184 RepID=A0AA39XKS9_9PEZI|nr:hypothetical protein B0T17DRAFT_624503 [Bombardia bombarda]